MHDQGRISIRLVQVEKIIGAEWSLASLAHLVLSSSCGARPWSRSSAASGPWHPPPPPPSPAPAWSRSPPARSWWRLSDHSYSPGSSHCTACLWAPRPSAAWAGAGSRCTRGGRRTRRWCRRSPSTRSQSDPPPENGEMLLEREYGEYFVMHGNFVRTALLVRHCVATLGLFVCIVLWMLIRTRKIVTSSVIRPGIISGFTRKLKIGED